MAIVYQHRKAPLPQLPTRSADLQPLLEQLARQGPADRYRVGAAGRPGA